MTPVALRDGARDVRLKWHQLRRHAGDPPFARRNLRDGLAGGASLEVDIRLLACGRFVCLHDPVLESETTGHGSVAEADAETVRGLRMRDGDEPLLLLDELVETVRAGPAGPRALVQLDLCCDVAPGAGSALAAALGGDGRGFILGGHDWDAVTRLGESVPGLALGYDPSDEAARGPEILRLVRARAAGADTIYLRRDLVRASVAEGTGLVAGLQALGHRVDCWTLDHGAPEAQSDLRLAVAAGCDQITTNTPAAWVEAAGAGDQAP